MAVDARKGGRTWARPAAWPIAVKLALVLVVVSLVPMAATTFVDMRNSLELVERAELGKLSSLASATAGRLDQLLEDTRRAATFVALDAQTGALLAAGDGASPALRASAQEVLANAVRANDDLASAFLLDAKGRCVASTRAEELARDFSFREYFVAALRDGSFASEILTGSTTKLPGIYFSRRIDGSDGRALGVAVVKLTGDRVSRLVDGLHPAGGVGGAFLVDGYGVVVSHADPSFLYRSLGPLAPETLALPVFDQRFSSVGVARIESLGLPALRDRMVGATEAGTTDYRLGANGTNGADVTRAERQIVGFAPLRSKPWTVGVYEPERIFSEPLRRLERRSMANAAGVFALVTLVAILLARTIVRPLRRLVDGARAIERRDFAAAKVDVRSDDEIGALGRAFNSMVDGLRERERELEVFGRMVSPEVRQKLLVGRLELGGETLRAAVLFSDLRGFSTLSEQMAPQAVVGLLNEYLTAMVEAIAPYQGYINNFIGDAIVVVFGAPIPQSDAETRAVSAALAMRRALTALNERRAARGDSRLANGIGISVGEMVAGQIGSPDRMLYTVIGDAVNVAARLEALTKEHAGNPVLVTRAVADAIRGTSVGALVRTASLGPVKLKGRGEPVEAVTLGSIDSIPPPPMA
jgi:class 3 adenylate cyclase